MSYGLHKVEVSDIGDVPRLHGNISVERFTHIAFLFIQLTGWQEILVNRVTPSF